VGWGGARPRLSEDADTARLARFVVATLEGAWFMSRVKGDANNAAGIATELKRSVRSYAREREPAAAGIGMGSNIELGVVGVETQ
jgi:hypothetical protein